ncbi:MAG TPA: ParB/RepB/Spo0J family partition protein, partial [Acidimicrobiales bacterium]|nr:ParB/RepB/Spo0J family partition protein [Acidimicrobiales bacterium]
EEAAAYQQLIEDFNLTQEQLAARVGKSRPAIANTLRLFQLTPQVQKLIAENQLTAGHARALLGTPDRAFQEALAKRTVSEGLSVREVEEAVKARNQAPTAEPDAAPSEPAPRQPTPLRPPGLLELEQLLADHLSTRVSVAMGAKKGRVVIDFADLEDLERIYRTMVGAGPPEAKPSTIS